MSLNCTIPFGRNSSIKLFVRRSPTMNILGLWIVLGPKSDELFEMVWTKDGPITRQVIEVVHYDGHEQVDYLKPKHKE